MTPAERLIAAADLLDKRAGESTAGPWVATAWETVSGELRAQVQGDPREGNFRTPDGKGWTEVCRGDADCAGPGPYLMQADARYIATMHPEVGKAVAGWLRETAARADEIAGGFKNGWSNPIGIEPIIARGITAWTEALAIADLLLAGAS